MVSFVPAAPRFSSSLTVQTMEEVSAVQQVKRLEQELWLERCLNQLVNRFNGCFVSIFSRDRSSQLSEADKLEAEIFQALVCELGKMLDCGVVAIALPSRPVEAKSAGEQATVSSQSVDADCEPDFKIHYCAAGSSPLLSDREIVAVLPDRQRLPIGLGAAIASEILQSLQCQDWQYLWPMKIDRDIDAWLIVLPMSSLQWPEAAVQPLSSPWQYHLVERAIQQCKISICQTRVLQAAALQQQRMKARQQELLRSNQLKSEFLANTSHEIRTPLSSILGFTQLLQEQGFNPINPRHQEYLKVILGSGQHLLALINDILDLSKIEANQLDLQWDILAVSDLCESVLELVKEKANRKGLALQLDIDPMATLMVGDTLRLKQMLFNLLSNALKFTMEGTVGLKVNWASDRLHFTVWDTGPGISKEQQSQLFQPYAQMVPPGTEPQEGTGLGLALTQKLAECHGGWVKVESKLGQGSKFAIVLPHIPAAAIGEFPDLAAIEMLGQQHNSTIASNSLSKESPTVLSVPAATNTTLPLKPEITATIQRVSANSEGQSVSQSVSCNQTERSGGTDPVTKISTNPQRILLVEDHAPNARLIVTYLCKLGYEISWVKHAKDMWQSLRRSLPAIILMDIHLPDTDGLILIKQLRASDRYQAIPIVVQTALAMKGDREMCLAAGATDYISKPINLTTLGQMIQQYSHWGGVNQ